METLNLEITGKVATLTFNRPEAMNTYNWKMSEELPECLESIVENKNVSILLLRGANNIFMAGGDIGLLEKAITSSEEYTREAINSLNASIDMIYNMDKLVVAAVEGACAGAGLSIMLAADFAICADNTKFNTAYMALGLTPDGGMSYFLPRIVGPKKALELLLCTNHFDAKQASDLGLVNNVISAEKFDKFINKFVNNLSLGPNGSQLKVKHLIQSSFEHSLNEQLGMEADSFISSTKSKNFAQGIKAFLNKEKPVFNK
tara:strand:- start:8165 stop:8944 length:780 start_codon:yes stop_codon:yes gene_type:complete